MIVTFTMVRYKPIEQGYSIQKRNLLPLCILEGLYIEKQLNWVTMNDKNENGRGGLVRLTATRV